VWGSIWKHWRLQIECQMEANSQRGPFDNVTLLCT
jgi:hypothetical protein